jgi:hypothetical protein
MLLALAAFVWMWVQTHRAMGLAPASGPPTPPTVSATPVRLVPTGGEP